MTRMRERTNDPELIAAWNENTAFISVDGGAKFQSVVHAPGEVRDVKFDVYGRMVILIASLPDGTSQLLGDGPVEYVVTTAFDPASVL